MLCDLLLSLPWHWDHWLRSAENMAFMNNNKEKTYLLANFQVIIAIINKRLVVGVHIYTGEPELQHWHGHAGVWSLLSGRESLQDCGIGGDWAGEAGRGLSLSAPVAVCRALMLSSWSWSSNFSIKGKWHSMACACKMCTYLCLVASKVLLVPVSSAVLSLWLIPQ